MVTWLRDGLAVNTRPGLQQSLDGTCLSLTMERVRQRDQGTYCCQLTTDDGLTVASATWVLRVQSKTCLSACLWSVGPYSSPYLSSYICLCLSSAVSRPPVFLSVLQGCSATEGQTVSLQVCVEGKPAPRVRWLLDGQCL